MVVACTITLHEVIVCVCVCGVYNVCVCVMCIMCVCDVYYGSTIRKTNNPNNNINLAY